MAVYETKEGTVVAMLDPGMMSTLTTNPALDEVATEVSRIFQGILTELETAPAA